MGEPAVSAFWSVLLYDSKGPSQCGVQKNVSALSNDTEAKVTTTQSLVHLLKISFDTTESLSALSTLSYSQTDLSDTVPQY